MKAKVLAVTIALQMTALQAVDLALAPSDVRIEQSGEGGYHLWIRKKSDIGSVLLTETTKDPLKKADNFAYRAPTYNTYNGDERRMLDGAFIPMEKKIYSLIDSTPEKDAQFGEAFHIFIPWVIEYGYPWSRNGQVYVVDGTFINIRAFQKPYADYAGPFEENPYVVRDTQAPKPKKPIVERPEEPESAPEPPPVKEETPPEPEAEPEPNDDYMKETVSSFGSIAEKGGGKVLYSKGERDIMPKIAAVLDEAKGRTVDLVLCLDTTESMQDDILSLKKDLVPMISGKVKDFTSFRIGMILYKDYFEEYVTKRIDFSTDFRIFQQRIEAIRVYGGRDIPEAVHEALFSGVSEFDWQADKRILILIGDAPPHPIARGTVTEEMVMTKARERGVEISVIILPE